MDKEMLIREYEAPCGRMLLGVRQGAVCLCDWADRVEEKCGREEDAAEGEELLEEAVRELDEYFAGRRKGFDVPVMVTGTEFQRRVREALREIGYGQTASYSDIARRIGRPRAVRAVANAIATNPISIFLPCHRVIGSDGSLTGYRGGLDAKRYLLTLEKLTDSKDPARTESCKVIRNL